MDLGKTDGISLTTPAGTVESTIATTSEQAHEEAADITNLYAARAELTRPAGTSQNPPDELPEPLREVAGDEVESREGVDKERRAHERVNEETSWVDTTTTIPSAPQECRSRGSAHHRRAWP